MSFSDTPAAAPARIAPPSVSLRPRVALLLRMTGKRAPLFRRLRRHLPPRGKARVKRKRLFNDTLARKISPLGQSQRLLPSVEMTSTEPSYCHPERAKRVEGSCIESKDREEHGSILAVPLGVSRSDGCGASAPCARPAPCSPFTSSRPPDEEGADLPTGVYTDVHDRGKTALNF